MPKSYFNFKDPDPKHDFLSLMTLVADNVAAKCHVDESENYLQIPCVVSTLKKRLCFPKLLSRSTSQHPEGDTSIGDSGGRDKSAVQQNQNKNFVDKIKVDNTQ